MEKEQLLGTTFTCEQVVTPDMTAASAVPGTPNVFGTPVLVALVEKTCFMCMDQVSGEVKPVLGLRWILLTLHRHL